MNARISKRNERRVTARQAIVEAAEVLFLNHGFSAISMDDLARAAGVARRTLYNQFVSKEEILREMLQKVSEQLEGALPPGVETQGDVEQVLRLIAKALVDLNTRPQFVGMLRMVVAESRLLPWIGEAFEAVIQPQRERFERYIIHLDSLGILDCPHPALAVFQFIGLLNEVLLWPQVMGHTVQCNRSEDVVEEAIRMFLLCYRRK